MGKRFNKIVQIHPPYGRYGNNKIWYNYFSKSTPRHLVENSSLHQQSVACTNANNFIFAINQTLITIQQPKPHEPEDQTTPSCGPHRKMLANAKRKNKFVPESSRFVFVKQKQTNRKTRGWNILKLSKLLGKQI